MNCIPSLAGLVAFLTLCIGTPQGLFSVKAEQKQETPNNLYNETESDSISLNDMMSIKSKSLVCNHVELSEQLLNPKTPPAPIQVSRDEFNGIEISGGTLAEMYYHLGYQLTVDRLWQLYFNVKALNGQLSTIIGNTGLTNDRAIRRATYTDAEFLAQYANFSDIAITIVDNQISGINQRIMDVLANPALLPAEFTVAGISPAPLSKAEFLRYLYNVLRQNGGEINEGNNQLSFLQQLGNLVASGKSFSVAQTILSDVYDMRKKRSYGIAKDSVKAVVTPCVSSSSAKCNPDEIKNQTDNPTTTVGDRLGEGKRRG